MAELIAALNVTFPPTIRTVPPFGTVSISQFTVATDGAVFLVNPTPERLILLQQVIDANPITPLVP